MSAMTCRIERPIEQSLVLAKDDVGAGETWLHLFTEGHYLKGTFKEFSINERDFDSMIRKFRTNLSNENGTQVLVDYNHASIMAPGEEGKAAGWVVDEPTALKKRKKGKELWAKVSLTDKARKEINDGEWRYISPEFIPRKSLWSDKEQTPQLLAIALTNRPATELAPIDSTMLSFHVTDQPFNKEDEMDRDEVRALIQEVIGPLSTRLSAVETPQVNTGGVNGAGMVDTDALDKAVQAAIGNALPGAIAKGIEPVSTKLSEFEEQREKEARERIINKTLSKHIERGAVTPEQVSAVREMLMLSADDDAFTVSLKAQDAIFSAIPSKSDTDKEDEKDTTTLSGKDKGDEAPDKPMLSLSGDGDTEDNGVSFVALNEIQGTGKVDSVVLSIQKFVDTQKENGKTELEALRLAHAKFGDDKYAAFVQVDDSGFGEGAIDAEAAG